MCILSRIITLLFFTCVAWLPFFASGQSVNYLAERISHVKPSFYVKERNDRSEELILSGEITHQTLLEARAVFEPSSTDGSLKLHKTILINSLGGDVQSAIAIGQLLRANRVTAVVTLPSKCASACVLSLAGAVIRMIAGDIIIHRPYMSEISASPNYEQTQATFGQLRNSVRTYLEEMNVSILLWDAMVSVSPSDAHTLSWEEIVTYGLNEDPVEEELIRQAEAKRLGISVNEYLRREATMKMRCVPIYDLTNLSDSAKSESFLRCFDSVINGIDG